MPQPKTRAARLKCKNCGNSVVLNFANRGIPTRSTINLDDDDPAATLEPVCCGMPRRGVGVRSDPKEGARDTKI